eukprot:Plantae.Rhodophyta-Palmaria_palmata.ctg21989.p1 GENE.Plantae.Rhodophyta-Palmaria_palmata.ctg21989~~Plantae.Rhodophyta-Palmaria_palmata.ctg21989.p1  ORF type:complete len:217 (-),score=28.47 Plantae.Rhodophyta-Palmaria_palmata.ctg21989:147-773(-)
MTNHSSSKKAKVCFSQEVSFNPGVMVRKYLHRNQLTSVEIQAAWYSFDEIRWIKVENELLIDMVDMDLFVETDLHCARGLDNRTPSALRRRVKNRSKLTRKFLQYQREGASADELADFSRSHTRKTAKSALIVASIDARVCEAVNRLSKFPMRSSKDQSVSSRKSKRADDFASEPVTPTTKMTSKALLDRVKEHADEFSSQAPFSAAA